MYPIFLEIEILIFNMMSELPNIIKNTLLKNVATKFHIGVGFGVRAFGRQLGLDEVIRAWAP